MKFQALTYITFLFYSLSLFGQSDFEQYKKEQNESLNQYKKDYYKAIQSLDKEFEQFISGEKERLRASSTSDNLNDAKKIKASTIENMYPKQSKPIPLKESVSVLNLALKQWDKNKVQINDGINEIDKKLSKNEALLNIESKDKNLTINDKISSPENNELIEQSSSEEVHLEIEANRPIMYPLKQNSYRISSNFSSARMHPILHINKKHEGIDLAAKKGTPIYATANGIVKLCKYSKSAGKYIIIDHQNGYTTSYMHLNKSKVRNGQRVKRGQLIGEVGNSGYSTGPHLHYEIRKAGDAYDPAPFLLKHFN